MNNVTPEKKAGLLKTLAIIGLFGVIILIAWLSVQIVSVFPSAISSLASLADSVYSYDPTAEVEIDLKPVAGPIITGNEFTIGWDKPAKKGTYTFSYECQDGLSLQVKTAMSDFKNTECGSTYDLGTVGTAQILVNSEKKSVLEMNYTVSYFKTNSATSTTNSSQSVTVLNPRLAPDSTTEVTEGVATTTEEVAVTEPETGVTEPAEEVTPVATTTSPTTEAATTTPVVEPTKPVVKPAPVYEYVYEYAIPTSNPNGFTDLEVTYIGIGRITSGGNYLNTGKLTTDEEGAMQFSVKNIGTKTSEDWYFTAKLPGGITYESTKQTALKPNEKSLLTISFPAVDDEKLYSYSLSTKTDRDTNSKNNSASWSIFVLE
jgi:hypothetical protein